MTDQDNSFGLGFYPLPARLSGLGRFVENLKPTKLLDYKVWPRDGSWMLVAKADTRLSIMGEDMKSLIRLGLVRVQCNDLGTLSFYFQDEPFAATNVVPVPTSKMAYTYDRR